MLEEVKKIINPKKENPIKEKVVKLKRCCLTCQWHEIDMPLCKPYMKGIPTVQEASDLLANPCPFYSNFWHFLLDMLRHTVGTDLCKLSPAEVSRYVLILRNLSQLVVTEEE